jgi:hypothetical protein
MNWGLLPAKPAGMPFGASRLGVILSGLFFLEGSTDQESEHAFRNLKTLEKKGVQTRGPSFSRCPPKSLLQDDCSPTTSRHGTGSNEEPGNPLKLSTTKYQQLTFDLSVSVSL